MKKVLTIIIALLIATISSTATVTVASAASQQDVKKFISTMNNNRSKLLKFKKHKNGTLETVYVINKKRYTATYQDKGDHIFFYIRPDGTHGDKFLEMVGGDKGQIVFGANGGSIKKSFNSNVNYGKEYEAHWQNIYNTAISDALKHFQN